MDVIKNEANEAIVSNTSEAPTVETPTIDSPDTPVVEEAVTTPSTTEVKIDAPWLFYRKKLYALLGSDSDITISEAEWNDEHNCWCINVECANEMKAMALGMILVKSIEFGATSLSVTVTHNGANVSGPAAILNAAFANNPNVNKIISTGLTPTDDSVTFCMFKKEVTQIYVDNLGDYHGNYSCLMSSLAEELLIPQKMTFYNMDVE